MADADTAGQVVEDQTQAAPTPPAGWGKRWTAAVAVGLLAGLPLGWLLSYAAALPFLIGIFFFMLFGLMIGASMFRVGAKARPVPARALVIGITFVVLWTWTASLAWESRGFAHDQAKRALKGTASLEGTAPQEFKADVIRGIRSYLREQYPPGGTIGYARWCVASGKIPPSTIEPVAFELRVNQRGWFWILRAVLCITLLGFGVASQALVLQHPPKEPAPSSESEDPPTLWVESAIAHDRLPAPSSESEGGTNDD
jgi:hypothetical protein